MSSLLLDSLSLDGEMTNTINSDPGSGILEANIQSSHKPIITDHERDRAKKFLMNRAVSNNKRYVLLATLLSQLSEVPFEEVAKLLNYKESRLEKFMHGSEDLPGTFDEKGRILFYIFNNLHQVLDSKETSWWLNKSIPDLQGDTPLNAISRGSINKVFKLTESYLDNSFT